MDKQHFWKFCFKMTWQQQRLLHQKELLVQVMDAFHEHKA